jgi:hypothetical protein
MIWTGLMSVDHQEIRWAYLQAGRELTSAEIFQFRVSPNKVATTITHDGALWPSDLYSIAGTGQSSQRRFWEM